MEPTTFVLVQDDSFHWYLIPEINQEAFEVWVEDQCANRRSDFEFGHCMINLSQLRILQYKIED